MGLQIKRAKQNMNPAAKSSGVFLCRMKLIPDAMYQGCSNTKPKALPETLKILVDSGNLSFLVRGAVSAGDSVFVLDSKKRTLVYSLKSGEKRGEVFGSAVAVSATGERVLIENGRGVMDLYDTETMKSLKHFTFPSRIVEATFLKDDKVMVLTADENVYEVALANQKAGSIAKQPATP